MTTGGVAQEHLGHANPRNPEGIATSCLPALLAMTTGCVEAWYAFMMQCETLGNLCRDEAYLPIRADDGVSFCVFSLLLI